MTKFNKDMYAKMRSKKDKPLSSLGKRIVHVTGKGPPVTPATLVAPAVPGTEVTRTAFPATSIKNITTPISKKPRLTDKGNEKADSRASSIWDDAELAVERAHEFITAEDLKVFLSMPSNEVVARHVHRLVQLKYLCNFSPLSLFFFFFFFLKAPIFFSGVGGESSHHSGVPYSGSQGRICEERLNCRHGRGHYP